MTRTQYTPSETDEFLSLPEIAAQIAELEAALDARYEALREPAATLGTETHCTPSVRSYPRFPHLTGLSR